MDDENFEPFIAHDEDDLILADLASTIENYSQDLLTSPEYTKNVRKRKNSNLSKRAAEKTLVNKSGSVSLSGFSAIGRPENKYSNVHGSSSGSNLANGEHLNNPRNKQDNHTDWDAHISNAEHSKTYYSQGVKSHQSSRNYVSRNIFNSELPYSADKNRQPQYSETLYQQSHFGYNSTSNIYPMNALFDPNSAQFCIVPIDHEIIGPIHQPLQNAILPSFNSLNLPSQDQFSIPDASLLLKLKHNNIKGDKDSMDLSSKSTASLSASKSKSKATGGNDHAKNDNKNIICSITGEKGTNIPDWQTDPNIQASWRDLNKNGSAKGESFLLNVFDDSHICNLNKNDRATPREDKYLEIKEMLGSGKYSEDDHLHDIDLIDHNHGYEGIHIGNDYAEDVFFGLKSSLVRKDCPNRKDKQSSINRRDKSLSAVCLKFINMFVSSSPDQTNVKENSPLTLSLSIDSVPPKLTPANIQSPNTLSECTVKSPEDKSSGYVVKKMADMFFCGNEYEIPTVDINTLSEEGSHEDMRIDVAAEKMGVHVRRIYEVLSILELLSLVTTKRGAFRWKGTKDLHSRLLAIQADGMTKFSNYESGYPLMSCKTESKSLEMGSKKICESHVVDNGNSGDNSGYSHSCSDLIQEDASALVSIFQNNETDILDNLRTNDSHDDDFVEQHRRLPGNFGSSEGLAMLTDYATRYIGDQASCGVMGPVIPIGRMHSLLYELPTNRLGDDDKLLDNGIFSIWDDKPIVGTNKSKVDRDANDPNPVPVSAVKASPTLSEGNSGLDSAKKKICRRKHVSVKRMSIDGKEDPAYLKPGATENAEESQSLVMLCKGFLELFLVGFNGFSIHSAIRMMAGEPCEPKSLMVGQKFPGRRGKAKKTLADGIVDADVKLNAENDKNFGAKSRRLYDIANVLSCLGLLCKSPQKLQEVDMPSRVFYWNYKLSPQSILALKNNGKP